MPYLFMFPLKMNIKKSLKSNYQIDNMRDNSKKSITFAQKNVKGKTLFTEN